MAGNFVVGDWDALYEHISKEDKPGFIQVMDAFARRIDNYFTLFTYVPTFTQGATSTGGASDFTFLNVVGFRIGPWVWINATCAPSKTLAAGTLFISLPPELPVVVSSTVDPIGTISWEISPSVSFNLGEALVQSATTFFGKSDGSTVGMGAGSPLRTVQTGDTIRFNLQYQTTAVPF